MIRTLALIATIAFAGPVAAAGGGGGEEKDPSPYLELDPDFVLNIGDPEEGRNYVKADVALRFETPDLRKKAETHTPWLRHELVMLLSGQPVDRVRSAEGLESLEKEALAKLNERLEQEMPKAAKSLAEKQKQKQKQKQKDKETSEESREQSEKTNNAKGSKNGDGETEKKKDSNTGKGMVREVLFEMIVRSR